jgi:hypothetical protein
MGNDAATGRRVAALANDGPEANSSQDFVHSIP